MTIKGITVTLLERTQIGVDGFNQPIYTYTPTEVENVLVAPSTSQEITDSVNLYGKKALYTLGIPKGDTHDWTNQRIQFFGETWQSFGFVIEGIEDNIPLSWHKKVMVERYG